MAPRRRRSLSTRVLTAHISAQAGRRAGGGRFPAVWVCGCPGGAGAVLIDALVVLVALNVWLWWLRVWVARCAVCSCCLLDIVDIVLWQMGRDRRRAVAMSRPIPHSTYTHYTCAIFCLHWTTGPQCSGLIMCVAGYTLTCIQVY